MRPGGGGGGDDNGRTGHQRDEIISRENKKARTINSVYEDDEDRRRRFNGEALLDFKTEVMALEDDGSFGRQYEVTHTYDWDRPGGDRWTSTYRPVLTPHGTVKTTNHTGQLSVESVQRWVRLQRANRARNPTGNPSWFGSENRPSDFNR